MWQPGSEPRPWRVILAVLYYLCYTRIMSPGRRTKWAGPIAAKDLSAEQLARFRNFFERFCHYRRTLPTNPVGTGNAWQAYETAATELGITADERRLLKRLPLSETFPDIET
jgi:hypothetical protein